MATTPPGGTASVTSFTYDLDGKVETQSLNGDLIANLHYDGATGLLTSVDYPTGSGNAGNGTSLFGLTHNAVVSRTSTPPVGTATTIWYSGPFVLTGTSGAVVQTTVSLPGGATVEIDGSGTKSWSYPDLHGDNIIQADGSGARIGSRATYDPFGQPIDPATGNIGTNTADEAVADTSPGQADQAWAGGAGKLYEHGGDIATIEMGARQYVPGLGRFLETDSVTGGNASAYNYPNDPINSTDWTGMLVAMGNLIDGSYYFTLIVVMQHHSKEAAQARNAFMAIQRGKMREAGRERAFQSDKDLASAVRIDSEATHIAAGISGDMLDLVIGTAVATGCAASGMLACLPAAALGTTVIISVNGGLNTWADGGDFVQGSNEALHDLPNWINTVLAHVGDESIDQ